MSINSGSCNTNEWGGWVTMFCGKIEAALHSAWGMGLSGASLQLGFILTPSGGCYVEDESFNFIIGRKTVITITHKDDNCFWFEKSARFEVRLWLVSVLVNTLASFPPSPSLADCASRAPTSVRFRTHADQAGATIILTTGVALSVPTAAQ